MILVHPDELVALRERGVQETRQRADRSAGTWVAERVLNHDGLAGSRSLCGHEGGAVDDDMGANCRSLAELDVGGSMRIRQ